MLHLQDACSKSFNPFQGSIKAKGLLDEKKREWSLLMKTTAFRSFASISAALALSSVTNAAMIFTDEAEFLSRIAPSPYVEGFSDELLLEGPADPVPFTNGTYSYTLSTPSGATDVFFDGVQGGAALPSDSVTISFTSGNVTAVGASFYATNSGGTMVNATVTVSLSDGTVLTFPTLAAQPASAFRGFTSVGGTILTSVTLSASQATGTKWANLDNLIVGVVPEPATYASLLGLSVLGFVVVRRRAVR